MMPRFFSTLLVVLLAVSPNVAQAQEATTDEVYLEQVSASPSTNNAPGNSINAPGRDEARSLILGRLANGDRGALGVLFPRRLRANANIGLINQQGSNNRAEIFQDGRSNVAMLFQQGTTNTALVNQIGSGNTVGAYLRGNGNVLDVTQRGNNNIYVLDIEGSGQQLPVTQIGNGNRAVQVGRNSQSFGIEQRGNDMEIVVQHNGVR